MKDKLERSIVMVSKWVEEHHYKAYDPGDGSTSFLQNCTFNNHFLERMLTATVLRVPFNIRPLIGIRPHISTKGMGYMAWGYTKMYKRTKDPRYRNRAEACLE